MTPTAPERTPTPRTLAEAFDPHANALDVLRLLLAATVAVVHTSQIGFGWQPHLGATDVGGLAVDAFFVLSGFLVTRSFLRLNSLPRFLWHRALRILPGFWTSLALTALVVAPVLALLQGRPLGSIADSAGGYALNNALLRMQQFGIAGLPGTGAEPDVLNGSLWTLWFEAACYGIVAVLGVLGILRRGRFLVPVGLILAWGVTVAAEAGHNPLGSELMLRLGFVFMLGSAGFLFADRIPVHGRPATALGVLSAALLVAGLLLLQDHRALAGPAFAYLCLLAVVRLPWRPHLRWDLSYGIYVWHWPVAQVTTTAGLTSMSYLTVSLLVTVLVATGSWLLVERPALRWKNANR